MKIGIVTTHAWPIPNPARTGDIYFLDLAIALKALGHDVTMFSPPGTDFPEVRHMPCANGKGAPTAVEAELECWRRHKPELAQQDIVHDCSTAKLVNACLGELGRPTCCTVNGGPWRSDKAPVNLIVQTHAQRGRILRGATDYEGSRTPELGGQPGVPVKDAHVVHDGVDTDFYCPSDYSKDAHVLWLNRWHPTKGCAVAIQWAKQTGSPLLVAGERPDNETSDYQRDYAKSMHELAKGAPSVTWEWLPGDQDHNTRKRELYRRANALIYPTQFQEPFGLSQVEAMACGTPVIATRYGSIPEVIVHNKTGWVCNDDAVLAQSMTDGVRWATESALPADSRAHAVERFSRDAMARRYLAEYQRCVAGERW